MSAHVLGGPCQALAHGALRVEECQGGQALDGVEFLGGQGPGGGAVAGGHGAERPLEGPDRQGHHGDRDGQQSGGDPVDAQPDDEDDQCGGGQGGDHLGGEGGAVGGGAFDTIGGGVDESSGAFPGALGGAEREDVGDDAVAQPRLGGGHRIAPQTRSPPGADAGEDDTHGGPPQRASILSIEHLVEPPPDPEVGEGQPQGCSPVQRDDGHSGHGGPPSLQGKDHLTRGSDGVSRWALPPGASSNSGRLVRSHPSGLE